MRAKSNNIEIIMGNETDEVVKEFFEALLQKYQEGLEEKMRGIEFVFDNTDLLNYNLHEIGLNGGGSNLDSPKWLKNQKATINPKNNDDKCFQYAVTVAINYQKIKNNPEEISNIKLFIDQYNWNEISFSSKRLEKI